MSATSPQSSSSSRNFSVGQVKNTNFADKTSSIQSSKHSLRKKETNPLRACEVCPGCPKFRVSVEFVDHLRHAHSTKEGGSFICRYGPHNLCPSLPLEGVSDKDYEEHVIRSHVMGDSEGMTPSSSQHNLAQGATSPPQGDRRLLANQGSFSAKHRYVETPCLVKDSQTKRNFTVYSSTQNLCSVLTDPNKSRREIAAFFTRHHGSDFVEKTHIEPANHLPRIKHKHFENYVLTVGKKHKRHMRDERLVNELQMRRPEFAVGKTKEKTQSGQLSLEYDRARPNLDEIPKVFLGSKYSLEDPSTFEIVFLQPSSSVDDWMPPSSTGTGPFRNDEISGNVGSVRKSIDSLSRRMRPNKLLQEKLTHYLDLIETQIGQQIASRSGTFFRAMTSHDELQTYLAQTKLAVQKLRNRIHEIDSALVQKAFRLLALQQARKNQANLLEKLSLVATVKETQPTVQMLLNSLDYLGALDVIATTQEVLKEELKGIVSFRHLSVQLAEIQNVISKMLQEEFVKYLQTELNRPVSIESQVFEEQHLSSVVMGLLRVKEYRFTLVLKEEISTAVKNLLRETIKERVQDFEDVFELDPNVSSLADQMRKMNFDQWIKLLAALFSSLGLYCQKIQEMQDILLDVVDIAGGRCLPPSTPGLNPSSKKLPEAQHLTTPVCGDMEAVLLDEPDYIQLRESMAEISLHVCRFSQERSVRVIHARSKDGFLDKLTSEQFLKLSQTVTDFVDRSEQITGIKKVFVLRSCLQTLAGKFATKFHEDRKAKLGNILDSENWRATEVPALFQEIVDRCERTGRLRDVMNMEEKKGQITKPTLVVEGEEFTVVGTSLLLLRMIAQYCQTVDQMPCLVHDLLNRLVELLKNFNSRTCQLILGAGALQLVGLKTISAKNLALASRCLQLIAKYIPVAENEFEKHLPPTQAHVARHFAQVLKDYNDHIQEITNKLLSVMDHHLTTCLKKWEQRGSPPSACFVQICKHMKKFHESLVGILPPLQIQKLFTRIHSNFKEALVQEIVAVNITPQESARYGYVCSEFSYYMENLRSLPCCSALEDTLNDVMAMR